MVNILGGKLAYALKIISTDGWTPFHAIVKYQPATVAQEILNLVSPDIASEIISTADSTGITPLHLAVCFGDHDNVKLMLNKLGDDALSVIKIQDNEGHNSFHSLVIYQEWKTIKLFESKLGNDIKELLCIPDNEGKLSKLIVFFS